MAAKAKVRIEGEDATAGAWRSAMAQAQTSANRLRGVFKSAIGAVGFASVAYGLTSVIKQSIEFGDEMNKAAIKAGIGGKAMSELAYAAKLADVDISSLSTGLKKMQVSLSEAGTGAKGPTAALAALGLQIDELKKLKPEAQFELIADRISRLADPADRARAAVELFGKAGADLLPLFSEGAEGIQKARIEAEKLGLSFDDTALQKFGAADDAIKRLSASWAGFAATLALKVVPSLTWTMNRLAGLPLDVNEQIANLEDQIAHATGNRGMSIESVRAGLRTKLEALRKVSLETSKQEMGIGGRPASAGKVPGFAMAKAAEDGAKAKEKANAKAMEAILDRNEKTIDAEFEYAIKKQNEKYDDVIEQEERINEARQRHATELAENAEMFKDAFLNAWDDMVNTGKFKWDELLKYMIAEFARRGIVKLFDTLFTSKSGGGAGVGDWLSKGWDAVSGLFGGGRATGGSVQAGKFYEVGERGRELFAPGMNGSIIPNSAMGGVGYAPVFNIDARGADIGLAAKLPRILKAASEATEARIVERINRRVY